MTNANQNKVDWLVLLYVAADDVSPDNVNEATLADECNKMLKRLVSSATIAPEVAVVALTDDNLRSDDRGKYEYMTPAIRVHEKDKWRDVPFDELDEETQLIFSIVDGKYEVDTGTPRTLAYFIRWALREYPANKVMLSIIGHGGGWSVRLPGDSLFSGSDVEKAGRAGGGLFQPGSKGAGSSPSLNGLCPDLTSNTALSTVDLRDALVFGLNGRKLDVLFLDACLMGMIEVAYELRNNVHYLVAGQSLLWSQLPYEIYLNADSLYSGIQPAGLAHIIVQLYNSRVNSVQKSWAISAINLANIDEIRKQVEQLAIELVYSIKKDPGKVRAVARAYHDSQQFDYNADLKLEQTESYVDIFDFAAKLSEHFNNNNQPQLVQPNPASNAIGSIADAIRGQTGGRRFRPVNSKSGSTQSAGPKTILGSVGFDPRKTVISSFAQTDEGEEQIIHVDRANGLSIYFPMGEVVDPIDDPVGDPPNNIDDQELKNALEQRLKRYTSHLSFAKAAPNWVELLNTLPQLLDTNGIPDREALLDDLKTILLPSDALEPAGEALPAGAPVSAHEALPTDKVVRKIFRQPTWRRRIFYRPRQLS